MDAPRKMSKMALLSVGAGGLFALLALVVPNERLLPIMNGICIGIVGTVSVVYWPLLVRAWGDHQFDRVSQLVVGMFLMWLSLLGSRMASLYINITGDSASVANSPVITFLAYMAIIGGVLHISGPAAIDHSWQIDQKSLCRGFIFGTVVAVIAVYVQYQYQH